MSDPTKERKTYAKNEMKTCAKNEMKTYAIDPVGLGLNGSKVVRARWLLEGAVPNLANV